MPSTELPLTQTDDGVVVRCWVVPGASRSQVKGLHGGALKLSAPPEGGRANAEACRILSDLTGLPARPLTCTTSRARTILLQGGTRSRVEGALASTL